MLVIGLTGPSGAGKGEVATLFASWGLPVINADNVYRSLLIPPSSCLRELTEEFGHEILAPTGELDRPKLSSIVFSDPTALQRLNSIAHRYVMEEIRRQLDLLRREGTRAAVLDAPQLFEAGAERDCATVVSVLAQKRLRLERIMERDGLDADSAMRRINAQKSDDYFRAHSDYVIENNGAIENLRPNIKQILLEMGVIEN
ncbi:MAG: dephospho-CoA kinase [Ruminococcaceae bacterium]|nr:dephospho-CoA kinase [Oscillospiraceae bacterium]